MKSDTNDLQLIKKYYGENMMHLCRSLFPTLLEKPGLLFSTLSNAFAYSKYLYDDIVNNDIQQLFVNYIYSYIEEEDKIKKDENVKSPKELLDSVGYDLYECTTEEEVQSFKKYYAFGEELCTFKGKRLKSCHVFFAVKKNVDEIKREDFIRPYREDEYGTSVMSIQFGRRDGRVSIKNRYNHTVNNPDATYSNDLNKICPGLKNSFMEHYPKLKITCDRDELASYFNGYVMGNDKKLYKYYSFYDDVYYCYDNYLIDDGDVKHFDKNKYLVFDHYILDIDGKKIFQYGNSLGDSFIDSIGKIDKLLIRTTPNNNKIIIINYNIMIVLNSSNQMIEYHNNIATSIGGCFLIENDTLRVISLPNVKTIHNWFLTGNYCLEEIYLPNVLYIGERFIKNGGALRRIELPKVVDIRDSFLLFSEKIEYVSLPNLKKVGRYFLCYNNTLTSLSLPNLEISDGYFMESNTCLQYAYFPKLLSTGDNFLIKDRALNKIYIPNVEDIGDNFLRDNELLQKISISHVTEVGDNFLKMNRILNTISCDELKIAGRSFLINNTTEEVERIKARLEELQTRKAYKSWRDKFNRISELSFYRRGYDIATRIHGNITVDVDEEEQEEMILRKVA